MRRRAALVAALVLPASLMAAPANAQGPTPSPAPALKMPQAAPVLRELDAAKAKAVKTGARVALPSRYTETMKVWANTDGKTLHAELTTEPVQLEVPGKDGGKSWQPIDTTVEVKADGTLAPKLVKTPLAFGGEGATTLVTVKDKDGTVALGWDRKLPKPTVDGNTITYPDAVAKGADLVLTARPNGYPERRAAHPPSGAGQGHPAGHSAQGQGVRQGR